MDDSIRSFGETSEVFDLKKSFSKSSKSKRIVLPGEKIVENSNFMRGHGTYVPTKSTLIASVAGRVEQINKLISVRPLRTRYNGEIGDVVVGRIIEVQQRRWKVDTNSRQDSFLPLAGVNLPGGELRRKTAEDEMMMREYLSEGDLISAEVKDIYDDGSLSLHTRSLKYGKLGQGILVKVSPSLIERRKTHFFNLVCGAHVIIANNGNIWISQVVSEGAESGGFALNYDRISDDEREIFIRVRNCILALAQNKQMIHESSISYSFDASLELNLESRELLLPEIMHKVTLRTQAKLEAIDVGDM